MIVDTASLIAVENKAHWDDWRIGSASVETPTGMAGSSRRHGRSA
jgi:hypothetical protein